MTVYVDNARIPYRGMLMSHMIADTTDELLAMARKIGLRARHIQAAGTYREHFDVCIAMRQRAIQNDAQAISRHELVTKLRERRAQTSNESESR